MVVRLNSASIQEYLVLQGLCEATDVLKDVQQLMGKNLNLQVQFVKPDHQGTATRHLLIKQGPIGRSELPKQDFEEEWIIHRLLASHPQLLPLQALLPEGIQFDATNAIQIFRYLEPYEDLGDFYEGLQQFTTRIPVALGSALAMLHQATFQRHDYRRELDPEAVGLVGSEAVAPDFRDELENLTPEIFKQISIDGLKFYRLYNRSEELSLAIAQLEQDYAPCCLMHHDLKFRNILLHRDWRHWQPPSLPASPQAMRLPDDQGIVRVIDWEQWAWGDPALDVGALVAEYLRLWLKSLVLSRDIDLKVALQLAAVPLDALQPSLSAFLRAYLAQFPQVLAAFPTFPTRVLRFAGLALIGAIQDHLHYREPFGNLEISMLQVAKSLLCNPEAAMITVFGCQDMATSGVVPHVEDAPEACSVPSEEDGGEMQRQVPLPRWVHDYSCGAALADLLESVRIEPPWIAHPAYQPLDLSHPGEHGATSADQSHQRLKSLPEGLRQGYLLRQVRNYLYDIYFSGEQERYSPDPVPTREVSNDAVSGLNVDYLHRIQEANCGIGFSDPNWRVTRWQGDRAQVEKDGLLVWIDPASDLAMREVTPSVAVGTEVALRLPNATLNEESYRAIGNGGEPVRDRNCITIYFNVTAEGALFLMEVLTKALNQEAWPFEFAILTDPSSYGRFNSAGLTLEASRFAAVRLILQDLYPRLQSHLSNPIPLFTYPLAAGIGLAEVPQGETDFGLARCQILAEALLGSHSSPESRHRAMQQVFAQRKLDWQRPHLNPGSDSPYPPLELSSPIQAAASLQ